MTNAAPDLLKLTPFAKFHEQHLLGDELARLQTIVDAGTIADIPHHETDRAGWDAAMSHNARHKMATEAIRPAKYNAEAQQALIHAHLALEGARSQDAATTERRHQLGNELGACNLRIEFLTSAVETARSDWQAAVVAERRGQTPEGAATGSKTTLKAYEQAQRTYEAELVVLASIESDITGLPASTVREKNEEYQRALGGFVHGARWCSDFRIAECMASRLAAEHSIRPSVDVVGSTQLGHIAHRLAQELRERQAIE